jgi:hypothetical protein
MPNSYKRTIMRKFKTVLVDTQGEEGNELHIIFVSFEAYTRTTYNGVVLGATSWLFVCLCRQAHFLPRLLRLLLGLFKFTQRNLSEARSGRQPSDSCG